MNSLQIDHVSVQVHVWSQNCWMDFD